jgi:hypothetical protein
MLQRCYKGVTKVLDLYALVCERYCACDCRGLGVTRMLQRCYKGVTKVSQRCYKGVTKVLQRC